MKRSLITKQVHSNSKYFKTTRKGRLLLNDYNKPCEKLAKFLLGKVLVRNIDEVLIKGKIVETECYPGGDDRCSHSFQGRVTERNKAMFMNPGTFYVYMTYGMYFCTNISSKEKGGAVLLRALEPLEGLSYMEEQRKKNKKTNKSLPIKDVMLCNGPSKLCQSFSINKELNTENLCTSSKIWVKFTNDTQEEDFQIITTKRIGLDNSKWKEWVEKPFRYYIFENNCVSKRDKTKEKAQNIG